MKDKLTKHHKKRSYFFMRNILFISLGILLSLGAVAVPVSISYIVSQATIAQSSK